MSPAIGRSAQNYDLLLRFGYLQVLDVLSTLAFLANGVAEANPFVQFLMNSAGHPLAGLLAVKVLAILIGLYCQFRGRFRALRRANVFFAGLVVWNLFALILWSVR